MAGPLKDERRERYCQELAKGLVQDEAYERAGFVRNRSHAARLAVKPEVRARVAELLARAAAKAEVTVADIARQLDEDREFARKKSSAAAAVSATLGKAKVLGLIVERQEHTGKGGGPIEYRNLDEDEIDARLRALAERNAGRDRPLAH
jgi:phage terminase small subunit